MAMFDLAFDGFTAFQQAIWLIVGFVFFGLGVLIALDHIYWKLKAERVKAIFKTFNVGVSKSSKSGTQNMYYPIYEYTARNGERVEAYSDSGSSSMGKYEWEQRMEIMIRPGDPHRARSMGYLGLIMGLIFMGIGAIPIAIGFNIGEINLMTFIMIFALLAYGAAKFATSIKPRDEWEKVNEFRARSSKRFIEKKQGMPRLTKEEFFQHKQDVKDEARKAMKFTRPIMLVLGIGCLCGGYFLGKDPVFLIQHGKPAVGEVVDIESYVSHDSDGSTTMYYSIVRYSPGYNESVEFEDVKISERLHDIGEEVDVLYDADNPQRAMVDRGWMNWILPGGFGFAGLLLLFGALKSTMRSNVRRV